MPDNLEKESALLLFTKAPVQGEVKTRFIPHLGEVAALKLYKALLIRTLENIRPLACKKTLWVSGGTDNTFLKTQLKRYHLSVAQQQGENLGERLCYAIQQTLNTRSSVMVIGGDCVSLDYDYFQDALSLLEHSPCVIGPALDGGFVFLAFNRNLLPEGFSIKRCFYGVDWGTEQVYQQTLENLKRQGLQIAELPVRLDVDTPDDLRPIAETFEEFRQFLS